MRKPDSFSEPVRQVKYSLIKPLVQLIYHTGVALIIYFQESSRITDYCYSRPMILSLWKSFFARFFSRYKLPCYMEKYREQESNPQSLDISQVQRTASPSLRNGISAVSNIFFVLCFALGSFLSHSSDFRVTSNPDAVLFYTAIKQYSGQGIQHMASLYLPFQEMCQFLPFSHIKWQVRLLCLVHANPPGTCDAPLISFPLGGSYWQLSKKR